MFVLLLLQLVTLPANPNVDTVVGKFIAYKIKALNSTPDDQCTLIEVMRGIKEYFNIMLGNQLLYKFERPQYSDMLKEYPDLPMSKIYGTAHLLRLFVRLGLMLSYTTFDEGSAQMLLGHIHDFIG
ncbi:unnamed protein product [Timema podura]|uniref:MRG domain-containing protein n=1 Tax=Timema podura TaxID=61482 RepID=A0ABN7NXR9_TIMPD|nr:unnamed protein product [Timema podura]